MNFNTKRLITCFVNVILTVQFSMSFKLDQQRENGRAIPIISGNSGSHHLRSPFHPPDENGNTVNFQENHLRSSLNLKPDIPLKSPYTPPPNAGDGSLVPVIVDITAKVNQKRLRPTRQTNLPVIRNDIKEVELKTEPAAAKEILRSPFQPPKKEEFASSDSLSSPNQPQIIRETNVTPRHQQVYRVVGLGKKLANISPELKTIIARQQENSNKIPSISEIQVQPRTTQTSPKPTGRRVKVSRGKPRHITYQNRPLIHRDMHDVGPGVTPWTRYTSKPRNFGKRKGNSSGQSIVKGRCGRRQYSPRNQICCQGNILRRQGVQPSCCGSKGFDAIFNKCCNGQVVPTSTQRPGC